jgi:hypothetical protein
MNKKTSLAGLLTIAAVFSLLHRYGKHSGATRAEYQQPLPGDEAVPRPELEITNAITIHAPAEKIWPWLVQLGYYRGGWFTDSNWKDWDYLPDKVMRTFVREEAEESGYGHRDTPTATQVLAEFQNLNVGDVVLDGPPGTAFFTVAAIEPNRYLVLYSNTHLRYLFPRSVREDPRIGIGGEFTWGFFLQQTDGNDTRLLLRTRGTVRPGWYRLFINTAIPIANIFLAHKMLSGIKKQSELVDPSPVHSDREDSPIGRGVFFSPDL